MDPFTIFFGFWILFSAGIVIVMCIWTKKDSAIADTEPPKSIDHSCNGNDCKCKDKHCGDEACCNKDGCGDCGCDRDTNNGSNDQED